MKIVPLELALPDGPAALVPGSLKDGQPRYERNGKALDVDVTIPRDLAAAGWFWFGSVLYWRAAGDDMRGIGICTRTFPPPLCFDQARKIERVRAELDAAARPAPAEPKRRAKAPAVVQEPIEPAQMAMEI